ncbi:uncharacterized protein DUF1194 [Albidovulum inexpectatum]|uniref:Uncharacterized protein DUF1194 n=1 Tax=Albidovulum inexpectatum TaxID=196587 RepID=A0A2S5JFF5_9RHOB|nr:DUF1194 domain-containing protein [Albidovulum inexpectatum]PPB80159.1 uncharacterized protein DUF1194 [Albidovulum inexpectatum]
MVRVWTLWAALVAALLGATGAGAQCRLALLLALDVSASVDELEDNLQRQGLANALLAPDVVDAFLAFPDHPVALAAFEWSGRWQQDLMLDWTLVRGAEDLLQAARTIQASQRQRSDLPTALGYALGHAAGVFARGPKCDAAKLDVSGDGINNDGFPPTSAYRAFDLGSVIVNGLAISTDGQPIADYYRNSVIRGRGAFVIEAHGFEDFEDAMRRKLLRELRGPVIGRVQ